MRNHSLDRNDYDPGVFSCFTCGTKIIEVGGRRIYIREGQVIQDDSCPWRYSVPVPTVPPGEKA